MNCFAVLLVLLCCTGFVTSSLIDGLLPNGNFEQGPNLPNTKGANVLSQYAIPEWEISGYVEYVKLGQKQGDMLLIVPEGNYAVRLGNQASIKTNVSVTTGLFHTLSFSVARTCAQAQLVNVSVSSSEEESEKKVTWGLLPIQTMYSCNGWDSFSWGFMAESDEVEIGFNHPQTLSGSACGPIIDLVALKAFPPAKLTGILNNGDFEEGPLFFVNTTTGILIPPYIKDHHSPLLGWTVESLKAVRYIDSDHFAVPEGERAVELVAGRESVIGQTVNTVPGKTYNLEFYLGDAGNKCEGSMVVEVYFGKSIFKVTYDSTGDGGSELIKLQVKANTPQTRVKFLSLFYHTKSDFTGTLCGPVIDGVSLG